MSLGMARPTILPLAPPFRSQCGSMIYTFYMFCTAKNKRQSDGLIFSNSFQRKRSQDSLPKK